MDKNGVMILSGTFFQVVLLLTFAISFFLQDQT